MNQATVILDCSDTEAKPPDLPEPKPELKIRIIVAGGSASQPERLTKWQRLDWPF